MHIGRHRAHELIYMRKKGQLAGEDGEESLTPVEQFYALAA
jgi:hypothetical protein